MNLNDLKAFDAVARCQGFVRAAEMLNRSQPTVTVQVRNLEKRYGVELFYRTRGQSARLTPFGERLFDTTQQLFNFANDSDMLLSAAKKSKGTFLRVGAISPRWAVPLMSRMITDHPDLELSLTIDNSNALIEAILDYRIDIAFLGSHEPEPRCFMKLVSEPEIVLIGHRANDRYRHEPFTRQSFATETLLHREPGSETRALIDNEMQRHGYASGRTIICGSREGVLMGVENSLGVAPISIEEIEPFRSVQIIRFADFRIFGEIHAVCLNSRRHIPIIAKAFDFSEKLRKETVVA